MEAITYEELMNVNGGLHIHDAGEGGSRRSWWSRNKKTVISYGRAALKGFSGALAVIWIFSLATGL